MLSLRDYLRLRQSCNALSRLSPVATLPLADFLNESKRYGPRAVSRIRFRIKDVCNELLVHLCSHGHSDEFLRALRCGKAVSDGDKRECFRICMKASANVPSHTGIDVCRLLKWCVACCMLAWTLEC